jgi:FkbM family methyltransferase
LNTDHGNSTGRFERIRAEIAAETPKTRAERWQGLFDRLAGQRANRLVLFGTGQFGQWVLGRLRRAGVEPCCFSDNNPARWGSHLHGVEVLSPSDAVQRFGQNACFVVTIYNGSSARKQLREMGCRQVLAAPLLFWKYLGEFMPDLGIDAPERLVEQAGQIRQCFALLADEESRHELCNQIEWRYWMKPEYLPLPANQGELYFPSDLVAEIEQEVLVDCGAFDGDSIRSFMRRGQSFRHLYALEPDAANLTGLHESLRKLPDGVREKVTVWPYAVGDKDENVSFVETHDVASKVSSSNDGITVESHRLDSLPWQFNPTYIKMDIEGSEPFALAGGAELLKSEMPVLAICLYHRTEHLWQIPNLIHSLAPEYSLYLRRYAEDCWEQVCYAVPPSRAKAL